MTSGIVSSAVALAPASDKERMIQALEVLLNNGDPALAPPLPELKFMPCGEGNALHCIGPVSASQYDRLNYLAKKTAMTVKVGPSHDHADPNALEVVVGAGNLAALEALAEQEGNRRAQAAAVAKLVSRATQLPWYWDGLCLSTPLPPQEHPAHSVLERFSQAGVTREPYDLSVFSPPSGPAGETRWLSLHDCDSARLRLVNSQIDRAGTGLGR